MNDAAQVGGGNATLSGQSAPLAGALCLFGFFLHILLSDPLLLAIGFHYSGEEGKFYEKIHPGSLFIFASFAVLLLGRGNPLRQTYLIARDQMAFAALLIVSLLMFIYVVVRSGMAGSAFLLDTHLTVPICAIVLSYTPASYCRRAANLFIAAAAINGAIGIAEAIGKFRIFTFDPDWKVLHEQYFRASALRGHPLNNAMFTSVAVFIVLARRLPWLITWPLVGLLMVALVAFGGRMALAFSVLALSVYMASRLWKWMRSRELTMIQWFQIIALVVLAPMLAGVALYGLIESGIGERIAAHGFWDKSAASRQLAPLVFNYMKESEWWFGIPVPQIVNIVDRMNQAVPIDDIENPWLLMFMVLGGIIFPFWLVATIAFARRLMRHQGLALQLAVLAYYITASTSNSFGRKDSTYLIMVCAVMCAARGLSFPPPAPKDMVYARTPHR